MRRPVGERERTAWIFGGSCWVAGILLVEAWRSWGVTLRWSRVDSLPGWCFVLFFRACLANTEGEATVLFCDYFTCRKDCFGILERKGNCHLYRTADRIAPSLAPVPPLVLYISQPT